MKTKIFSTVVIMIFATGCTTTTTARRHFDDITVPSGMAYQADDSILIESPNLKAAHLVYRGRLEPVTVSDAMRTRLEAGGWRQVSRTNTIKDGMRQVYEKDGNAMELHVYEGLWYTYLAINASEVVQQAPVQTGSDTPPASVTTGIDPKAVGQAGPVLSDATGTPGAPPADRPAKEPTFTQRVKEFFTNLFTW
ncbi:MAG TPA: hypothetical protein VFE97_02440 [Methylomirabilota bacterium]|jgi:hypothetical protein|nr:hypothetical protein [Methylomirabilota bacterium]